MEDFMNDIRETKNSDIETLRNLIKDIKFTMMTTVEADGSLRSRPMTTQQVEFDGELWFFTDDTTEKIHELEKDQHVNLSYASSDKDKYVSVSGKATVVHDKRKAEELWNPLYKAWFPKGLSDPNLVLLKVTIDKAEYWDGPGSKVVQLFSFAKALATGQRASGTENKKISF